MDKADLAITTPDLGSVVPSLTLYITILVGFPLFIYFATLFVEPIKLRRIVIKIPIIAGLALCEWKDFMCALHELSIKIFLSSWPILCSALIFIIMNKKSEGALVSNFVNGELYLFCGSMLSSIFYIALKDRKDADNERLESKLLFPSRETHILIVMFLILGSAIIYALKKAGLLIPGYILLEASYYYFVSVVFLSLLASTINNALNGENALKYSVEVTESFKNVYEPPSS